MHTRAACGFKGLCVWLLVACFIPQQTDAAEDTGIRFARFEGERAARDVREIANWIIRSADNRVGDDTTLPFTIIDKKEAKVYVFDATGRLRGAAPVLLGIGRGDTALPGIGARELSAIAPKDRVTQAGRFIARLGPDSNGEDVLWLDYEDGLAMHRVITSNPRERRLERLNSLTTSDNRISWGCVNIPVKFHENVVRPAFEGTKGIVYVLPENKSLREVFPSYDVEERNGMPAAPMR